jgi:hypothetical protein
MTVAASAELDRGKLYEVLMGATSNPNATDTVIQYAITRVTASGSFAGTSYTPNILDPADAAADSLAYITATTDPTLAATDILNIGLNQRNSQRWQVVDESQMIVWPATTFNGLSGRALSPVYTGSYGMTFSWLE